MATTGCELLGFLQEVRTAWKSNYFFIPTAGSPTCTSLDTDVCFVQEKRIRRVLSRWILLEAFSFDCMVDQPRVCFYPGLQGKEVSLPEGLSEECARCTRSKIDATWPTCRSLDVNFKKIIRIHM